MNNINNKVLRLATLIFLPVAFSSAKDRDSLSASIDEIVEVLMDEMRIPGVAIAVIKDYEPYYLQGYGFANIEESVKVTGETFFELGSLSKAYTGLAISKLVQDGKISLEDDIVKYINWFRVRHGEKYVKLRVSDCLYHRTGIPFKTIGAIPVDSSEGALLNTVEKLVDVQLDFRPGTKFQYATLNYAILGLVIESASGISYTNYMEREIFKPLNLDDTWAGRNAFYKKGGRNRKLATGYKAGFFGVHPYDAPDYEGNVPAGYIITNAKDMLRWMDHQMGSDDTLSELKDAIGFSHENPYLNIRYGGYSYYAAGWEVLSSAGSKPAKLLFHDGNNPNFSSSIRLNLEYGVGVAVLGNLNAEHISEVSKAIESLLINGETVRDKNNVPNDLYRIVDIASTSILVLGALLGFIIVLFIAYLIGSPKVEWGRSLTSFVLGMGVYVVGIAGVAYCILSLPEVFFYSLPWSFLAVWGPFSLIPAALTSLVAVGIVGFYFLLLHCFPGRSRQVIFPLVLLGMIAGFGNALIIYVINEALFDASVKKGLIPFFILGVSLYVLANRVISLKLISMTNGLVLEKRLGLIRKILGSSYEKIEKIEDGRIQAGLNNDTRTLSNAPNVIIGGFTSLVTLVFCFMYIGFISLYGLLFSVALIAIGAGAYYLVGRSANRKWDEARAIESTFFKLMNHMLCGFKELSLNSRRKADFECDIAATCDEYRSKNTDASMRIANVFVLGELVFAVVIGGVVFVLPVLFKNIGMDSLRSFVFVLLYMTGPIHGVLNDVPQLLQIRIAWKRLEQLKGEFGVKARESVDGGGSRCVNQIVLEAVEYSYLKDGKSFAVGPISCCFRAGEITFITGGNGSGKTTLMKLISGLYSAHGGRILVDGVGASPVGMRDLFSTVFSDYFLFQKLYGLDLTGRSEEIDGYLKLLKMDHKVNVHDNQFSSLELSNGQRKRLALIISYLDDKPVFLFDEWAADQDPEFREYFYKDLLRDLRAKGKIVIAVTHDDRYFSIADRVLKLDLGRVV
ncbi:cyclic peptide export ABC transporter [Pelagicoccus sp. SDUM812002]|uniref:cyclic peptide export ABC transporter n=1 Tax=Pelagicoccus sp. SDUM812002 TaxID=3041266 RepID=UPI00280D2456|nr:cyclic peptide export ABC transporter [Pelagicoccus sp. SDUM812002]MDQ8188496.1 cyclic peptide export ABC transporter [Pelagicoccus sp. SDUM812002]